MNKFAGKLDLLTAAQEEHAGTNTERGPPEGTKNTATNGGVKGAYVGKQADGIEVYKTSEETMSMTRKERQKKFLSLMKNVRNKIGAEYVSGKHLALTVQTLFAGINHVCGHKNRNLATPTGEQAPVNTPEANSGTVPDNSIPTSSEKSNRKIKTSAVVRDDTVAPIEKRLRGDALLDAQDLIDTVMDIGGEVDGNGIGEDGFHYFEAFFEKFRWRVLSGDAVRRIKRTEKPHTVSDKCEKEELLPVRALPPKREALKMAEVLLKLLYTLPGQKVKR